jgi:uncharacterized membrane protein YjfL (UPF0719 family)
MKKFVNQVKSHMLWGILGMVIMISVFGILSLIMNTFGIENKGSSNTDIIIENNQQGMNTN